MNASYVCRNPLPFDSGFASYETLQEKLVRCGIGHMPPDSIMDLRSAFQTIAHKPVRLRWLAGVVTFVVALAAASPAREKTVLQYGAGLIVNIPSPEAEVLQVVEDVSQNTIIRGTKEYNKDEFVTKAEALPSSPGFPAWTEGGKVFYKVRKNALDPRNFKDSGDVGTLAVRYIVQPQGDKNTVLRIDAVFVEDFRKTVHLSNGSVESSEYKDIQDRLQALELVKKETQEALRQKQERASKQSIGLGSNKLIPDTPPATTIESSSTNTKLETSTSANVASEPLPPYENSSANPTSQSDTYDPSETLEQHVANLRHQVERVVKKPGAPLKSAPFHTASTLAPLAPGAEVLIVITSPYWYGVETHDGQHGWLMREELDPLP